MPLSMRRRFELEPEELDGLHAHVAEMVLAGAALGWLTPPSRRELGELVADLIQASETDDACLVLVTDDRTGVVLGFGYWTRREMETERPHADVGRVSIAAGAQGGGNGRALAEELIRHARAAGIEMLTLDVRGNNHAAMALYERLGFREYGRLPDFVAIGDERWDNVFYALDLRDPSVDDLVRHGDTPRGPGSSERR